MRNIVFLLLVSLLTGCFASKKRCERLYPVIVSTDTVVRETVRDSVVLRDTTIFVSIPGETLIDSVFVKPGIVLSDTIRLETSFALALAYYKTPKVHLILEQKGKNFEIELKNALQESYHWQELYTKILNKEVVKERYVPGFFKFCTFAFIGIVLCGIGFVVFKKLL